MSSPPATRRCKPVRSSHGGANLGRRAVATGPLERSCGSCGPATSWRSCSTVRLFATHSMRSSVTVSSRHCRSQSPTPTSRRCTSVGTGPTTAAAVISTSSARSPIRPLLTSSGSRPASGECLPTSATRVVVHLHGACFGSGIELPAFASRVIAAPDVRIALPELALGLIPGAGGTVSLPRRIGRHRTAQLALTGRTIDAVTALDWGLVDQIEGQIDGAVRPQR